MTNNCKVSYTKDKKLSIILNDVCLEKSNFKIDTPFKVINGKNFILLITKNN